MGLSPTVVVVWASPQRTVPLSQNTQLFASFSPTFMHEDSEPRPRTTAGGRPIAALILVSFIKAAIPQHVLKQSIAGAELLQ